MSERVEQYFITRHSIRPDKNNPESENYPGIAENGVDLAKDRVKELKGFIDDAPADAIVFIGGATYEKRTKSTVEVYGDGLKDLYRSDDDVLVLTKEDIENIVKNNKSVKKGVEHVANLIKINQNKKIILDYPMFINELDFGRGWDFWGESEGAFAKYLFYKHGENENEAIEEWIATGGKKDASMKWPDPNEVADNYLKGLKRLRTFIERQVGVDRPIIIGGVGHRWDLDMFIVKMIKGEVNLENYRKVSQGNLTNETEGVILEIKNNNLRILYRGEEHNLELDEKDK